jgi:hypothetical protein
MCIIDSFYFVLTLLITGMGFMVEELVPPTENTSAEGLFLPNAMEDMERVKLLQFSMD